MTYTAITTKGQVVIPSIIRKSMSLKSGTRFCVVESGGKIILQPLTADYFDRVAGILGKGDLVKTLLEERRKEKGREDKP